MIDVRLNFHSFGFLQPLARVFIDAVSMAVSRAYLVVATTRYSVSWSNANDGLRKAVCSC